MNRPLIYLALGGVAATSLFFLTRKASAVSMLDPVPPQNYGESTRVSLAVPAGWRRVTSAEVTPELRAQAIALRDMSGFSSMQYGTLTSFVASDGKTYATWIEQHYHPPGGAAQPWGFHHGVTLLAQASPGTLLDEWWGH